MNNAILADSVEIVREYLGTKLDEITIERAAFGLFFSGVKLSTGHGGLCFTPIKEIPAAVCCPSSAAAMPLSGKLDGRKAQQYLDDCFSDNILKKTLGIATLNALSSLIWELDPPEAYTIQLGKDAFDEVDVTKYAKSVVIGALAPMLKKLLRENCDFHVIEQDARTLKPRELPYYAPPEDTWRYAPEADLMVITGVTILNDTLPDILRMAKPGAEIIVTGPTASMMPEALLSRGVTCAAGIVVTDADALLNVICEAGSGYHFFGKSAERAVIRRVENA